MILEGWEELSKADGADSLTIRLLSMKCSGFTTTANHISTQLDNLQFNLNKEMLNKAEEVNKILKDVADLNHEIKTIEAMDSIYLPMTIGIIVMPFR